MTRVEYINILTKGNFTDFQSARSAVVDYIKKLYAASGDTLVTLLTDPWGSRSISAGGGSKSSSYRGAQDFEVLERQKERFIDKLLYAIGEGPNPNAPTTVEVRFYG